MCARASVHLCVIIDTPIVNFFIDCLKSNNIIRVFKIVQLENKDISLSNS